MASDLRISGLSSGIDTKGLIEAIMAQYRVPVNSMSKEQDTLKVKKSAWRDVNTRLANLLTKIGDLKLSSTFKSNTVATSDGMKVVGTASSDAAPGVHMITVSQIAKAHQVASDRSGAANADTYLNLNGTFQVNGKNVIVTVSDSLNSIKKKINDAQAGVTASVVDNRILIRNNEMGAGKLITFADDPATKVLNQLGVLNVDGTVKNTISNAQNAQFFVDELSIERNTNTVTDVITGLTLELKDQTTEKVLVTVAGDTKKAVDAIKAWVEQYNSLMSFIADKMSYDKNTKKTGDLFSDSSLMEMESSLRRMMSSSVGSLAPGFRSLSDIGIKTSGKEASLTVDEAKLTAKLQENADMVATLLGAAKTNVAYSGEGAVISGSSEQANYSAASANDGSTSSANWGVNGGWMDNTPGIYPDYLEVTFSSSRILDEIKIFTLDSTDYPAAAYGIRDFDLEYWRDGTWETLQQYSSNTQALIDATFDPITTNKIRLKINSSNEADGFSRVVEIQAFQQNDGIAARMYDKVNSWTRPLTGTLAGKDKYFDSQIKSIGDKISNMERRLEQREKALLTQFTNMEVAIGKMSSQSNWLSQQISALPNTLASQK